MMLSDFGRFPAVAPGQRHAIQALEQLRLLVTEYFEQHRRMRVRCFAHSMNGMSVPDADEALLDMTDVRHLAWRRAGVIAAGAGLSVWEVDRYVRQFGWKLPVVNDGSAEAPSLGGFVAAGGIGEGCILHGGFWESVRAMTIVDGTGVVRRLTRDDPLFQWLFGTMGGLGVVYEVELDLVPATSGSPRPVDACEELPNSAPPVWPDHLWLTLFVSDRQREMGLARLKALVDAHPNAWAPKGYYEYYLTHRRFNPPFLFEGRSDFIALGVWGDRLDAGPDLKNYFALESDFQRMVEECGFRRYFQSELIWTRRQLQNYVGAACVSRYQKVKAIMDPRDLLNRFMPERPLRAVDATSSEVELISAG